MSELAKLGFKKRSENMQFLYKYARISLFGQICQNEVSCRPEQRTCITNGGGLRGAQPPPFEKHGQRSEHIGFLTVHLFCIVLALRNSGGGGLWGRRPPPNLQNMDEDQNTYIPCTPLMDVCCSVFCDVAMFDV